MADTPGIGITYLEEAQAGKEVTANTGFDAIDRYTRPFALAMSDGANVVSKDNSRARVIILSGLLTTGSTVQLDDDLTKATIIYNETTGSQTVQVKIGASGTLRTVPEGGVIELWPGGYKDLTPPTGGGGSSTVGAYGSLPGASTDGALYLPNDAGIILRDNGTDWEAWGPVYPITRPVTGDFATWVNQGGATFVQHGPQVTLTFPSGANSGDNIRGVFRALPTAPYTITALITPHFSGDSYARVGIALRDSASGRIETLMFDVGDNSVADNPIFTAARWTSPTGFSANVSNNLFVGNKFKYWSMQGPHWWFRIRDDNTDLYFEVSSDFHRWIQVGKEARTAFLASADQCGVVVLKFNGSLEEAIIVHSWKQG